MTQRIYPPDDEQLISLCNNERGEVRMHLSVNVCPKMTPFILNMEVPRIASRRCNICTHLHWSHELLKTILLSCMSDSAWLSPPGGGKPYFPYKTNAFHFFCVPILHADTQEIDILFFWLHAAGAPICCALSLPAHLSQRSPRAKSRMSIPAGHPEKLFVRAHTLS